MNKKTLEGAAQGINRLGGKLFFRTVSIIPLALTEIVISLMLKSFSAGEYLSSGVLFIVAFCLIALIKYLWSPKRSIADIIEANS